jgi:mono/diheme cytochrome c family protein
MSNRYKRCIAKNYIFLLLLGLSKLGFAVEPETNQVEQGRRIYMEGILGSGEPLKAEQAGGVHLDGQHAACANCHRPSGIGAVEGDVSVPPITGNFLYKPDQTQVVNMDTRSGGKRFNQTHEAYTDVTLASAITTGEASPTRKLNAPMPHFKLGSEDMSALIAYLKQLSVNWSPGIDGQTIQLATVITPDVDPVRRKIFLDTLNLSITQKNGSTLTIGSHRGRHHMASAAEMVLGTERKWELHVWELQGAPETWAEQLEAKLKAEPVFAVLSGLSNGTWEPVHQFCETRKIPCWFPSVSLPVTSPSFYNLYFSRGVLLEADVLSTELKAKDKPSRVVQIRRNTAPGIAAAKALSDRLVGINVQERVIGDNEVVSAQVFADLTADDAVVVWLPGSDWSSLEKLTPPSVKSLYFSAELAVGKELPKSWQSLVHMPYPYELPSKRQSNLETFHIWSAMKKLPIVDESLQAEVFYAVEYFGETVSEMLDNLYRDYLLERAENMLSKSDAIKVEQRVRERQMRGKKGEALQQTGGSIYPHLSLGITQRFASKGAYIVHFADDGKLVADSDWIIP